MKHLVVLLSLIISPYIFAQEKVLNYDLNAQIPKDESVVRGELTNGLKYFIQKNDRPKKTVEMRLIIKVGSLQEEEDQLGVAHILEHMLFNGTKNFPKHKIIEYLEGIGLKFGADLNAHTSFDETVYKLSIPTKDIEKVNTAFQILEDWAHNALLLDEEIEAERGVVMEEYRLRLKGVNERVFLDYYKEAFAGTREVKRFPIGTEESILHFKPERLRDFYKTWYRPNLMAIAISGDIDVTYAEEKVKNHFSKMENPSNLKVLKEFGAIPYHKEKKIVVLSDPEITSNMLSISCIDKKKENVDGAKVKEQYDDIIKNLLNQMLNQRFSELAYAKKPPFLGARVGRSGTIVANQDSYNAGASVAENKIPEAIKGIYTELERAKRFGFTAKELEDAKKNFLSSNESYFNKRNERYSKKLVTTLLSEYKENWSMTSVDWVYNFKKEVVATIDLKTIQKKLLKYYTKDNQNIVVVVPEKEGIVKPKEKDIAALITEVENDKTILAYKETELATALISKTPTKGSVAKEEKLAHEVKKLTLSNGLEVYYKNTDFDTDYVAFKAFSYGGTSLLSDEDVKNIGKTQRYVTTAGIGGFKPYELKKIMSGKKVRVHPYVGTYDEGMNGKSKVVDMESLFQMIYLNFTAVNKDEDTYRLVTNKYKESLKSNGLSPKRVFSNAISKAYNKENTRYINLYEDQNFEKVIDATSYNKSYDYYTKRFENAGDFKFFFIGDFDEVVLKEYAELYLGSLPSSKEREAYKVYKYDKDLKEEQVTVYKGLAEKAKLIVNYSHKAKENDKEKKALQIFGEILKRKLRNRIREEKGGTYGINVRFNYSKIPISKYKASISFECAPNNLEPLKKEMFNVIDDFLKKGPTQKEVNSIVEQWELTKKKQLRQNDFWLNKIKSAIYWDEPIEEMLGDDKENLEISRKLVKKIANKYMGKPDMIAILLPEKKIVE